MANTSLKTFRENAKGEYTKQLLEILTEKGEDVGFEKANILNFPIVLENGEEDWVKITISIPTGSRDGEPYDGYGMRESYELDLKAKAEKKAKALERKKVKIEKDKKLREEKARLKAEREGKA